MIFADDLIDGVLVGLSAALGSGVGLLFVIALAPVPDRDAPGREPPLVQAAASTAPTATSAAAARHHDECPSLTGARSADRTRSPTLP